MNDDGVRPQIAILIIASTIKLSSLLKTHFWRKRKGFENCIIFAYLFILTVFENQPKMSHWIRVFLCSFANFVIHFRVPLWTNLASFIKFKYETFWLFSDTVTEERWWNWISLAKSRLGRQPFFCTSCFFQSKSI